MSVNKDDVINEVMDAAQFAGVFDCALKEANATAYLAAAILIPATFGFDSMSNSIGVSMANAHVKNCTSQYTNRAIVINLAPVIGDCIAAIVAKGLGLNDAAILLGKKAVYALSDVSIGLAGGNAPAALLMLWSARQAQHAGLNKALVTILYENAGSLIGDAVYSSDYLFGTSVVTGYVADVCIAMLLVSIEVQNVVAVGGNTALALVSGFALSSYVALLQSRH